MSLGDGRVGQLPMWSGQDGSDHMDLKCHPQKQFFVERERQLIHSHIRSQSNYTPFLSTKRQNVIIIAYSSKAFMELTEHKPTRTFFQNKKRNYCGTTIFQKKKELCRSERNLISTTLLSTNTRPFFQTSDWRRRNKRR